MGHFAAVIPSNFTALVYGFCQARELITQMNEGLEALPTLPLLHGMCCSGCHGSLSFRKDKRHVKFQPLTLVVKALDSGTTSRLTTRKCSQRSGCKEDASRYMLKSRELHSALLLTRSGCRVLQPPPPPNLFVPRRMLQSPPKK